MEIRWSDGGEGVWRNFFSVKNGGNTIPNTSMTKRSGHWTSAPAAAGCFTAAAGCAAAAAGCKQPRQGQIHPQIVAAKLMGFLEGMSRLVTVSAAQQHLGQFGQYRSARGLLFDKREPLAQGLDHFGLVVVGDVEVT